ncbi:MAG TPA: hypothetical protein VJ873_11610, partial [bacterium]|nr:hypothetical protein [bacterium]
MKLLAVFFLLSAQALSAPNAVTVTNSSGDPGTTGSFGWAVTTLNATAVSGAITFNGNANPLLSQTLASVSQSVTFNG